MDKTQKCKICNGCGHTLKSVPITCGHCHGGGRGENSGKCFHCNGIGKVAGFKKVPCEHCNSRGYVTF